MCSRREPYAPFSSNPLEDSFSLRSQIICYAQERVLPKYIKEYNSLMLTFPVHPCEINRGGCEHKCEKDEDQRKCACNEGFKLNGDGETCSRSESFFNFFFSFF